MPVASRAAGRGPDLTSIHTRFAAVMASRPLWPALLVTVLITALRFASTVDSDVAWQLWIAHRMHAGARLYRDIIEVNPPLWFWMVLPVDRVATLLHVRAESVLVTAIGGIVMLSLAATNSLLGHIAPFRRAMLLAYAALTLAAIPWMHLGQREQIPLIAALPYAARIAVRPVRAIRIGDAGVRRPPRSPSCPSPGALQRCFDDGGIRVHRSLFHPVQRLALPRHSAARLRLAGTCGAARRNRGSAEIAACT